MSWWQFWKKSEKKTFNDPLLKDGRMWLSDLRNLCEMNFDNPEEARRQIRQMQIEWTDAHAEGEVDEALLNGLNRRTIRLLRADADEWLQWLDNDDFWKPGWRDEPHED